MSESLCYSCRPSLAVVYTTLYFTRRTLSGRHADSYSTLARNIPENIPYYLLIHCTLLCECSLGIQSLSNIRKEG